MSPREMDALEIAQSRLSTATQAFAGFRGLLEAAAGKMISADGLLALIGPAVAEVDEAARELETVVH